jgi:multiple sugar transport system permease protein
MSGTTIQRSTDFESVPGDARPKNRLNNQTAAAMSFLLPNFLGFLVFTAGPVVFALVASFTNWYLLRPGRFDWIGLQNFRAFLSDAKFWTYFLNTLYLMLGLPISIAGSLFLAILLNQRIRGVIAYRTLFYLPSFTAGVALMIMWKSLLNPDFGPINAIIHWICSHVGFGAVEMPTWLASMSNLIGLNPERVEFTRKFFGLGAKDALILMGIWTVIGGNNMLLYLAALSNVPPDLYEAAEIDGAGRWARFRNVTWPQLAPTTFFITVMSIIGGLQGGFEQARVMTQGGPAGATTSLTYHIYQKAFEEFQMGYASALSWTLFATILVFTLIHWRFASKELNY